MSIRKQRRSAAAGPLPLAVLSLAVLLALTGRAEAAYVNVFVEGPNWPGVHTYTVVVEWSNGSPGNFPINGWTLDLATTGTYTGAFEELYGAVLSGDPPDPGETGSTGTWSMLVSQDYYGSWPTGSATITVEEGDTIEPIVVNLDVSSGKTYTLDVVGITITEPPGLVFQVDTTADAVDASPGDGACATAAAECSLRAAVMEANAHSGRDEINVPAGTYVLTIPGDFEEAAATADLDITDDLLLQGAGADCTTGTVITETTSIAVAGGAEGAISVRDGAVEISELCVTASNLGMTAVGGRLDLHDFALDGNNYGFRALSSGNASIHGGSIAGNSGGGIGGGVYNEGTLHLDRVRIEDNAGTGLLAIGISHGGVANSAGTLVITNSSISGNTSNFASAIHNLATLILSNVSIFGNTALDYLSWGTLYNSGASMATADLTNVTIDGNTYGSASLVGGTGIRARNTIVSDTVGCASPITSAGYNREAGTSCGFTGTGDQQSVAIAFTQDASGPTPTLVPISGANVQDQGGDVLCPIVDQRMHHRPPVGGCDIGAAELASAVACGNGLDDDGDGFCDTAAGSCTDGSTPGDAGCTSASDPQELVLAPGDVLTSDSDGSVKRLDPTTGDVRILARGLGLRGPFAVAEGAAGIFVTDGAVFETDRATGMPSLLSAGDLISAPRGISIDSNGRLLVADPTVDRLVGVSTKLGLQQAHMPGPPLGGPEYVTEDPFDGSLLVADYVSSTPQGIHRIDRVTGAIIESCTSGLFGDPRQLQMNDSGTTLWLVDSGPNRLFGIDLTAPLASCSPIQIGGGMGDAWGIGLDPNGDLIVASRTEGLFQYVDPTTGVQTVINESPDIARPHQIAVVPEPSGTLGLACGLALLGGLSHRRASRRHEVSGGLAR